MKKINIVGCGVMGAQIANLFNIMGYEVNIWNRSKIDKDNLNDPELKAHASRLAYKRSSSEYLAGEYAGEAWAGRKGIELLENK